MKAIVRNGRLTLDEPSDLPEADAAAGDVRQQHLSGLELAVFGARLPQPPDGVYRLHGE